MFLYFSCIGSGYAGIRRCLSVSLLVGRDRTVIGRHIRNIYKERELSEDITCAKFAHMIPSRI